MSMYIDMDHRPCFDGDIPRPQIDWQCDTGICEHSDRIEGKCECYNKEMKGTGL